MNGFVIESNGFEGRFGSRKGALPNVALVMFDGATKFPLIAIPLFILAGAIMNSSGISRRLIAFASALLGFVSI